jgi:hypothetical protein
MTVRSTRELALPPFDWRNPNYRLIYAERAERLARIRARPDSIDPKREFIVAMLGCTDAGWAIAEFSSRTGVFLAQKGIERRQFEITPADYGRDRGNGTGMK